MITQNFLNLLFPLVKKFIIQQSLRKKNTSDLKLLKDEEIIDKATYKNIKPVGPGKVHKDSVSYWYAYLQTSKVFTTI